jgi:hypothetical protein
MQMALQRAIDDLYNISATVAPKMIVAKSKAHFLSHLGDDVRRFGPAIIASTERYESYNGVVRGVLIHSNRQAPSRDAARAFSGFEYVKHIVTGGFWKNLETGRWIQAGQGTMEIFSDIPIFARLVGLEKDDEKTPGEHCALCDLAQLILLIGHVQRTKQTKNGVPIPAPKWEKTKLYSVLHEEVAKSVIISRPVEWFITANGDKARVGSHVYSKKRDVSNLFLVVLGDTYSCIRVLPILGSSARSFSFFLLEVNLPTLF